MPDTTVRLVNLQAGQLDMVERLGPTDAATVRKQPEAAAGGADRARLLLDQHQPRQQRPAGQSAGARGAGSRDRPRRAEPGGDRRPVHPVEPVRGAGQRATGTRSARCRRATWPRPRRCCNRPACRTRPSPCSPATARWSQQVGEVIQSMADEAGFDIKLQAVEANAQVASARSRRLRRDAGDLERPARSGRQRGDLAGHATGS